MNYLYMLFKYLVYSGMKKQSQREAAQGIYPTTIERALRLLLFWGAVAMVIAVIIELLPFIVPIVILALILCGFYLLVKKFLSGVR